MFSKYSLKLCTLFRVLGPVVLSAFSILCVCLLINPIACALDPSFHLLANRGLGKVTLSLIVIAHIFLLTCFAKHSFFQKFLDTNVRFFKRPTWLKDFFSFFAIFLLLHILFLTTLCLSGLVTYTPSGWTRLSSMWANLLWGFIVTFFLAWSEEVIFRGTLYLYLEQSLSPISSVTLTSFVFMLVHDLSNPFVFFGSQWRLGLGLFLLGMLLNLIFTATNKLYTGMGAHAGLVYVKVALRRLPLLSYPTLPFWLSVDLRQSLAVHALFCLGIIIALTAQKPSFFKAKSSF
ncbi:MAG: CPBP family intramembrane metalloprotease [Epsilonproteobacteria bacterium]|nr:CPBP family intramembrane metalloprotease [Campylobacterota bacterium]